MPTRKIHRTLRSHLASSVPPFVSGDSNSNKYSSSSGIPGSSSIPRAIAPKHIPFNSTIVDSDLVFELRMFLFTMLGAGCQFLHLFRSIWWLPYTSNNFPINYFLINPCLIGFIVVLLSRRLMYGIICKLLEIWMPPTILEPVRVRFRCCFFMATMFFLTWYATNIARYNTVVNLLYLCYPLFVYLFLFGFQTLPLFENGSMNSNGVQPLHACTNVARDIRAEVEELKKNFNDRIKQVLFNSVINAYYAGLLPCCFVPSLLHYDINWAAQHVGVIWLGSFTTYTVHAMPVRYCDILHRSALHLGYWDKAEPNTQSVVHTWQEDILWPFGSVVQHGKELYRGLGEVNVALPGNSSYARFYTIFWNPPLPYSILLIVQAALVLFQLILLLRSYSCWHNILSTSLLLVFNYYTLYIIGRNFFISQRLYNLEQAMHEKATI